MIVRIDIPENFFNELSDAYSEVNAMKSVIAEASANGTPILPSDSYHESYVASYKKYQRLTEQVVPTVCPNFSGANATWVVDFETQQLVIDLVELLTTDDENNYK